MLSRQTLSSNENAICVDRPNAFSAIENRPADIVAQPLVVKYELANRRRQLLALPPALQSSSVVTSAIRGSSSCSLDRVCGRTELVGSDVSHRRSLTGSICGMPGRATQVPGSIICATARRAGVPPAHFAPSPCSDGLYRLTRSRIVRARRLEEVQDMFCTQGRPDGEEMVIRIGERPSAANRDETWVPDFRKNHRAPVLSTAWHPVLILDATKDGNRQRLTDCQVLCPDLFYCACGADLTSPIAFQYYWLVHLWSAHVRCVDRWLEGEEVEESFDRGRVSFDGDPPVSKEWRKFATAEDQDA
jgi:hypothetical protein